MPITNRNITEAESALVNSGVLSSSDEARALVRAFAAGCSESSRKLLPRDGTFVSQKLENATRNLTWLNAVELSVDAVGVATSPPWLRILAGLFLLRSISSLASISLAPLDGAMVQALFEKGPMGGLTSDEWMVATREVTERAAASRPWPQITEQAFDERASGLLALGVVGELDDGYWYLREEVDPSG